MLILLFVQRYYMSNEVPSHSLAVSL